MLMWVSSLALFGAMLTTACTKNQRIETLGASLIAVNSAREALGVWDLAHQEDMVKRASTREEAERAVADYRAKRQRVVDTFVEVYRGLAAAALDPSDSKVDAAMKAVDGLLEAVKKFTEGT
jgi:hypothetical protein